MEFWSCEYGEGNIDHVPYISRAGILSEDQMYLIGQYVWSTTTINGEDEDFEDEGIKYIEEEEARSMIYSRNAPGSE